MRYAYDDLGQRQAGDVVVVRLRGSAPNVILLDQHNYARYRSGRAFRYIGGHYRRSPVELEIPEDGHWFVVVDLGGFGGRVRGSVEVRDGDGSSRHTHQEGVLVRA